MTSITRPQRHALYRVWLRTQEPHVPLAQRPTYRAFRRTARPGFDCLMVPYAGMHLGIEPDGYTHS